MPTEAVHGFAHRFRVNPKHLCPVFLLRIANGCGHDTEKRRVFVCPDVKQAIPVVEVVLVSILAGKHNHWGCLRVIRQDCVKFARRLAGGSKHDKRIVTGFGRKYAEQGIGLVEDNRPLCRVTQGCPPNGVGAFCIIFGDDVKAVAVICPNDAAGFAKACNV